MSLLVLIVVFALLTAGLLRLAVWSHAGSRRLTIAMLALGTASLVALPSVGDGIDRWARDRSDTNITTLGVELLTALGMYELGAIGLVALQLSRYIRIWLAVVLALTVLLVANYGGEKEFATLHYWQVLPPIAVGFILIVIASVVGLRTASTRARPSLVLMAALGVLGLGYVITTAVVMIAAGDDFADHYRTIVVAWSAPALLLLTVAGLRAPLSQLLSKRPRDEGR